jgi:hypothetical protein
MAMLYREEKQILYHGRLNEEDMRKAYSKSLSNDDFFSRNYDRRLVLKH